MISIENVAWQSHSIYSSLIYSRSIFRLRPFATTWDLNIPSFMSDWDEIEINNGLHHSLTQIFARYECILRHDIIDTILGFCISMNNFNIIQKFIFKFIFFICVYFQEFMNQLNIFLEYQCIAGFFCQKVQKLRANFFEETERKPQKLRNTIFLEVGYF